MTVGGGVQSEGESGGDSEGGDLEGTVDVVSSP